MIIKLATGDKVKKQSDYYYETKNKEDGTIYKVHPSAFNSKELNVTTPDVTVTAPRPKRYSSAFDSTIALEPISKTFELIGKGIQKVTDATGTTETASKISGSRFTIMKKECAKLERELRNFMIDICEEFGFKEHWVPYLVNKQSAYRSGQLPKFEEDLYKTTNDYYLIPTAETVLANMYADTILQEEQLPIEMCAYSPCFRSEAGSAGKDTTGMIRQHQFTKVEIFAITTPENGEEEHQKMLKCSETILQRLNLPYRVMVLCGGDIGFCSAKTYDLEVWLPGQNKYREICSCSTTTNFQSRRAKIRYEKKDGTKDFPYMLNSSALAIGRTIVALMENYQTEDGKVDFDKIFNLIRKNR